MASYLRLLAPTAFASDYDRILYLDADIFLLGGDLSRLLDVALLDDHPDALEMHDQSVLNLVFRGRWSELSVAWNWMYSGRFSFMIEACDPFLIHFAGRIKPWNKLTGEFPPKYPNAYRDFFLQHYPDDAARMPAPKSIFAAPKSHRKALLKQWYDFNRFMPYMMRFDDPYQVIDPD